MASLTAGALGVLVQLQNLASAATLSAFFALALRAILLVAVERGRNGMVIVLRAGAALVFLGLGLLYALFIRPLLVWDAWAVATALVLVLLVLLGVAGRRGRGRRSGPPGPAGALVQLCLMLALLLVACVTLMRAGFLALTEDQLVLLVDITGETEARNVGWAPPDEPARQEVLLTHHVIFRAPEGAAVAEAWLYGDEVAVKGRVLRLSPILNAAGVPNLFELSFAHNGYRTPERHGHYPHVALALPRLGPLAVHPWWRPLQLRLLQRWENGTAADSAWAIRSATIESTYFPLADADGRPVRQTFRLVLTPGGLTAG